MPQILMSLMIKSMSTDVHNMEKVLLSMENSKPDWQQDVHQLQHGTSAPLMNNVIVGSKTRQENMLISVFIGSHCINPPLPNASHNLKLYWNYNAPPAHGGTVYYQCNAGNKWNRFEHDFNSYRIYVKCLPDNRWQSVQWPTCKNG